MSDEGESGCEGGEGEARDRGRMTGRRMCGVVGRDGRWREREEMREKMRETRTKMASEPETETETERERETEREKERTR